MDNPLEFKRNLLETVMNGVCEHNKYYFLVEARLLYGSCHDLDIDIWISKYCPGGAFNYLCDIHFNEPNISIVTKPNIAGVWSKAEQIFELSNPNSIDEIIEYIINISKTIQLDRKYDTFLSEKGHYRWKWPQMDFPRK